MQSNRWCMSARLYERYLTTTLPWSWWGPVVVKSNQMQGADAALAAARLCKALHRTVRLSPVRQHGKGLWQRFTAGEERADTRAACVLEADRIVVTTTAIRHKILHRYQLRPECVRIIPNYVDIGLFAPTPCDGRRPNRVLYVGRLERKRTLGRCSTPLRD